MNQDRPASTTSISRRRMLYTLSIGGAGVALAGQFPAYAMQAARTAETPRLVPLNRFPPMVREFFVERENEVHQQRLKRLAELTTRADAEAYVQTVWEKSGTWLGGLGKKSGRIGVFAGPLASPFVSLY